MLPPTPRSKSVSVSEGTSETILEGGFPNWCARPVTSGISIIGMTVYFFVVTRSVSAGPGFSGSSGVFCPECSSRPAPSYPMDLGALDVVDLLNVFLDRALGVGPVFLVFLPVGLRPWRLPFTAAPA
jgi:hypothetical protein